VTHATTEAVIDKIAKLLNLAEGKGATANEAAVAAAKAQELMDRHRLDRATIDAGSGPDSEQVGFSKGDPLEKMGRAVSWKLFLGGDLAAIHSCRLVVTPVGKTLKGRVELILIGRPSDTQVVSYLYTYLTREIERLTKFALVSMRGYFISRSDAVEWGRSFRLGAVAEVLDRLIEAQKRVHDQAKQDGAQCRALVLLDDHKKAVADFAKRFVRGRVYRHDMPRQDHHGHLAGRRAGRNIALQDGLSEGKTEAQLDRGSST